MRAAQRAPRALARGSLLAAAVLGAACASSVIDPTPPLDGEDAAAIAAELQALLPYGGHPIGGHMARLVRDVSGDGVLVATVGDPLEFLRRYDEAGRRAGGERHVFSPEAWRVLEDLERELRERAVQRGTPSGAAAYAARR